MWERVLTLKHTPLPSTKRGQLRLVVVVAVVIVMVCGDAGDVCVCVCVCVRVREGFEQEQEGARGGGGSDAELTCPHPRWSAHPVLDEGAVGPMLALRPRWLAVGSVKRIQPSEAVHKPIPVTESIYLTPYKT